MAIMDSRRLTTALLITTLVLSCETSETEEQLDTCVWVGVEVSLDRGHNSSELQCEAPKEPSNGGYVSDVIRERYDTGDTITYHCNTGHRLIGHVNRTCNGTSKQWEPQEPYCQPEYIGELMRRLSGIEDKVSGIEAEMRDIKQSIATAENNTLQMGYNISVKVSTIDDKVTAMDKNVSAIYSMSLMELFNGTIDRERLVACTDVTKAIDEDTVSKCKTMHLGVRNGHSVSVYKWVIEDFKSKVENEIGNLDSPPFYPTVPGYKLRLKGFIYSDSDLSIYLQLLPGEYDDQLKWPFNQKHDVTVLTNDGLEVPHRSSSGEPSACQLNRTTSPTEFSCFGRDPSWNDVWRNKKHILSDGSVVAKLYLYN